ncbi:MAG: hypothetical protein ACRD40_16020, partial [Candidatus Acidiferrales bacterium]
TYYYSGPHFVEKVQEVKEDFPGYTELMKIRGQQGESTSRKDYFKDVFLGLAEEEKRTLALNIVEDLERKGHPPCTDIRGMVGGITDAPMARIPVDAWNSDRLKGFLCDMDDALQEKRLERVLTLAYTCMEGFFKAYVRKNVPAQSKENEIVALSKIVKDDLKERNKAYPGELFNVIGQTAHAINRIRDGFSESHFGEEAGLWVAVYARDLVNTHIRLLLHFM